MGGRAEAARLTATLHEVEASKELLKAKDEEIAKLRSQVATHDATLVKMEAAFTQKLNAVDIKAATSEAQASQLASALESLQAVVREQADFKAEMQAKLDAACKEVNERDTLIHGVQKQLEAASRSEQERESQREIERDRLAKELEAIGARSLDDLRDAHEMEKSRYEAIIARLTNDAEDAKMKLGTLVNSRDSEYKEMQTARDRLAEVEVVLEREREAFKKEMSEMKEALELQKMEVERYWQTYGKGPVGTTTPQAQPERTPKTRKLTSKP
eukprot:TRINITY_DN26273_c0_g1_i1.p1 TRINITY_DN26273_c0_g1~~TRINITY_DN26273_c0_g1_i1.p1  ORF type:complete len:279 (+),score=122.20 TRINITY_DN26273_c0_g1_i1:22-837(+)